MRFVSLQFSNDHKTVTVSISRFHPHKVGDRYISTLTHHYVLTDGSPSADRLGRLLAGRKHTHHPAQLGWGPSPAKDVYVFLDKEPSQ